MFGFPVVRLLIPKIGWFFRVAGVYTQFWPMFSLLEIKKSYADGARIREDLGVQGVADNQLTKFIRA
jgi:hypothetical protein